MSYYPNQQPRPPAAGQTPYAPQYAPYGQYAYFPHPNQAPYGYPPPGYAPHPAMQPQYRPPPQIPQPPAPLAPKESAAPPAATTTTTSSNARGPRRATSLKGAFTKELGSLLVAFGDDTPAPDTVAVLEEILIEYITDVCQTAVKDSKKSRLTFEDLRRALSHPADAQKLARMDELIFMSEQIKKSRSLKFGELGEGDSMLPPGL